MSARHVVCAGCSSNLALRRPFAERDIGAG